MTLLGIDIGKHSFHLHGEDAKGSSVADASTFQCRRVRAGEQTGAHRVGGTGQIRTIECTDLSPAFATSLTYDSKRPD
jgi:hypothetical protein